MTAGELLHSRTDALLRRLVRRGARDAVRRLIRRTRAEDLAAAMDHLTWAEQRRVFGLIEDPEFGATVLASLDEEGARELSRRLGGESVAAVLGHMEPDDATDVVGVLDDALRAEVLSELGELADDDTAEVVRELLAWPEESAGGLMSPNVFTMPASATCGKAIAAVQAKSEEFETVSYVYVVDRLQRLVGVTSLRALLTNPPNTPLRTIMITSVVNVGPTTDQEEVSRYVARYDLVALPVVDEQLHILGIVTVDDVVDVIHEEAAEDMMLMAGVSDTSPSVWQQARHRAGWLLATIAGGIVAAEIIGAYEETLAAVAVLAGFIPVIMGMGGNVGIQSATLAVRGLATGKIQLGGIGGFLWGEFRVGVLLGIGFAVLLGGYGLVRYDTPMIGVSVGLSILLAISMAGITGASLPVVFDRLGIDPAVATGPFVTTLVDLLGIVIYFNIARTLLSL